MSSCASCKVNLKFKLESWGGDKNKIIQYEGGQEISENVFKAFKEGRLRINGGYYDCSEKYFTLKGFSAV